MRIGVNIDIARLNIVPETATVYLINLIEASF